MQWRWLNMKYDYSVKVNGKWYQPNEKIPEESETIAKTTEEVTENDEGTSGKSKSRNTNK